MLIEDTGWTFNSETKEWVFNGKRHFHCEKCHSEDFMLMNGSFICSRCGGYHKLLCNPTICASS
jgi:hypothetical protein